MNALTRHIDSLLPSLVSAGFIARYQSDVDLDRQVLTDTDDEALWCVREMGTHLITRTHNEGRPSSISEIFEGNDPAPRWYHLTRGAARIVRPDEADRIARRLLSPVKMAA